MKKTIRTKIEYLGVKIEHQNPWHIGPFYISGFPKSLDHIRTACDMMHNILDDKRPPVYVKTSPLVPRGFAIALAVMAWVAGLLVGWYLF